VLQELLRFRQGGEVSDRQWRDVLSILVVQGPRLDQAYLETLAARCGVSDLLTAISRIRFIILPSYDRAKLELLSGIIVNPNDCRA